MTKRLIIAAGIAVLLSSASTASDSVSIRAVVREHFRRYPKMEIQDLYKLLYQATMGNEHLMGDARGVRKYLDDELARITADASAPAMEIVSPDSALVRVNLHRMKALRADPAPLVQAMLGTAAVVRTDTMQLRNFCLQAESLAAEHAIPFSAGDLHAFFVRMEAAQFPAVHHSKSFEELYAPAYRLVLRTLIAQ